MPLPTIPHQAGVLLDMHADDGFDRHSMPESAPELIEWETPVALEPVGEDRRAED